MPGLLLTGQLDIPLQLEFKDELRSDAAWTSLATIHLSAAPQWFFDLATPPQAQRFYRSTQGGSPAEPPALGLYLVPALELRGSVGSSVRVDYINQFGPTDAWASLATVTLTNTLQLFFETSAVGQPPRLYRLRP